ncbi:hypothetical protein Tco_0949429 [Tanacetum coccineum]
MAGGHDFHENEKVLQKDRSKGNQNSRRRDAWNTGNKDKDNRRRSAVQAQTQREKLGDASIEYAFGLAYTQVLKKVEAQLVAHQQSQLCQTSARDKAGLGYGDQMNKGVLSYENEVLQSVFVSRKNDIEDSHGNLIDGKSTGKFTYGSTMLSIR